MKKNKETSRNREAVLQMPLSCVTDHAHPYRLMVRFQGRPPSNTVNVSLSLRREGHPDRVISRTARLDIRSAAADPPPDISITVDTAPLAEGRYTGRLDVQAGRMKHSWQVSFHRLASPRPPQFPFGIYALPATEDIRKLESMLEEIRSARFNLICQHLAGVREKDVPVLDAAAIRGILFCPSHNLRMKPAPQQLRAVLVCGGTERETEAACLNRPQVRELAADDLSRAMKEYAAHAGFSGLAYYGDDLFLPAVYEDGRAWIACRCAFCRRQFATLHGVEPPADTAERRGVIPASDPWLVWMRHRCEKTYGDFVRNVERAAKTVAPAVRMGLCHGWPDNPFSSIVTGIYGPLTQLESSVSSYAYPFLRSPSCDFICHYEIARMNNRNKDVWMLGLFGADATMAPPWHITQNYWNMLAAGYKFIAFFSWWDYERAMEKNDPEESRRALNALEAIRRCGLHKDWILPAAMHWEDENAQCAMLYSFTTESSDVWPRHRGNTHSREVCRLYRAALKRHLPMKIICEEEIRAGILRNFSVLCLHDVRALPDDIVALIQQWVERGGLLFTDSDPLYMDPWHPSGRIYFRGAIPASPETMVEIMRDRFPPSVTVSSADVIARVFVAGETRYVVLVNNYADRYFGFDYSYDSTARNHALAALCRSEPVSASVAFSGPEYYVYDAAAGQLLGTTSQTLAFDFEPAWGKALALIPSREAVLRVRGLDHVHAGATVSYAVEMTERSGRILRGAFAVRAAVSTPSGRESPCSAWFGLRNGVGEFLLPIGVNDETGSWKIRFEGGFPRSAVELTLAVHEPAAEPRILAVSAAPPQDSRP